MSDLRSHHGNHRDFRHMNDRHDLPADGHSRHETKDRVTDRRLVSDAYDEVCC